MKSALFVQANVAVNTKLTSKVPFLFGNLVKNVQFRYGTTGKFFLGALFNTLKCPEMAVPPPPPQSFYASYAPEMNE
jgi:hypothetical protein